MCGIAGIIGRGVTAPPLQAMSRRMAHRGPDDEGVWISADQRVGLASRRLAIIDLSDAGRQPMHSASGSVVVFNGEIYNYRELRAQLESHGVEFRGNSDTEVLLAAYDVWGADCLPRLNGMFALAIYDARRGTLFAARDRFGEKPFHYVRLPDGTLAFASEIKSLLVLPGVPRRPDMEAVFRFLRYREADRDPQTFFEGIRSLPAAHMLEVEIGSADPKIRRYWQLEDRPPLVRPRGQLVEEFRSLLSDSTALRMRADVPVGSSLSGGIDSSAIVGLIAQHRAAESQHTFSARFPGSSTDEGRYIRAVVAATAAVSHEIAPDVHRVPSEIGAMTWHQEAPFLSLSVYAQWCVMRLARDHGVTVLLDGQGADEILGGYHSYFAALFLGLLRSGSWMALGREVGAYVRRHGLARWSLIAYHLLPTALAQRAKTVARTACIEPGFAGQYGGPPVTYPRMFHDPLSNALHETLTHTMLPSLLRYADRNSMAFSREVRLPYLDHRLVEFAFTLPSDLKMHNATTKIALRDAMESVLPPLVANRHDKVGYAPPQTTWLRGALKPWATSVLQSSSFAGRPWIDAPKARAAWQRYLGGATNLEADIWRWLSLEIWAQRYFDSDYEQDGG